jgi:UbiD family decarboxylase
MRRFIEQLAREGNIISVEQSISKNLELAGVMAKIQEKPVLFENVEGYNGWKIVGNLFPTREIIAKYFGIPKNQLIPFLTKAIDNPKKPGTSGSAPCQEVVEETVDLDKLPILSHAPKDGGNYVTSGIVIAQDKEYGRNCSFHRLMQIGKNKFAIRLLPRHTHQFLERAGGEMDVAVILGNGLNISLASAISVDIGVDELSIANALKPLLTTKCKTIEMEIPTETEIVLEGRITKEMHAEGPFVDLTETYDIVREQPVLEVKKITHRKNPIYHALLPGGLEHKMLMGMPREPTIFREVNKVTECKDVYVDPGGCSWLHGIVQIKKKAEDEGMKAIEAAFNGHKSMKHVIIVDEDINIYDPASVEWAIATRFQAKTGMIVKQEAGSSLDPSSDPKTRETSKVGIDATKPLVIKGKNFDKAKFKEVELKKYLE